MADNGSLSRNLSVIPPKGSPDYGDGRLWKDTDGVLFSTGIPISVSIAFEFILALT
jgi:hypothetical protein